MSERLALYWGALLWPLNALQAARGSLLPWAPVLIGCGIGLWFEHANEPSTLSYLLSAGVMIGALAVWRFGPELIQPLALALLCVLAGWLACGVRMWTVDAPVLSFRFYGAVTGRIVGIDRSQSDALRITLDQVWLERTSPARTPQRVRVSLRSKQEGHPPFPGQTVILTAHLSAPQGPVEPGAFDFRRMAYFAQLGAVGYSTTPLMLWEGAAPGARPIDRLRSYMSQGMMEHMPNQAGAFATGAMTGDRSWIRQSTAQDLRDSSLAHLLAISGQNLAFLIAFTFALIRYGLALIPYVALRVNTKKIAACASFFVAAFYLALSGSNVATERAFIMVTVMLGAVILDRKVLTLRSIALAGIIILLWKPESLLDPGFQMSFAATAALIAGFRALDRKLSATMMPLWAIPAFALFLSSLIGGLSTAPYAAAHFNRYADYGLLANLLTGPVMGLVVMPAGAIAALLAPFGLAAPALWVMEQGARWILFVAQWIAGLDGAVSYIHAPGPWALPLITLAGVWVILVPGRWRLAALLPGCAGFLMWVMAERPPLLIASSGALVGIIGPEGRALSAPRGDGFVAQNWLLNDGDNSTQSAAAMRLGMSGEFGARHFELSGVRGTALKGRAAQERLSEMCQISDFVVINTAVEHPPEGCLILGPKALRTSGSLALYPQKDGALHVVTAQHKHRVWTGEAPSARDVPRVILARPPRE